MGYFMFQQSLLVALSISMLGLTGCQVVSVKEQKVGTTLSNERDSILTRDELSEASLNVLSMSARRAPERSSERSSQERLVVPVEANSRAVAAIRTAASSAFRLARHADA